MAPQGESGLQSSDSAPGQNRHLKRDAAVEDEIFHCGYFADVVFKCRGSSGEVEDIYGQSALFALLSPVLRERLFETGASGAPLASAVAIAGDELKSRRQEVWLDNSITARGFREVARYIYRLPSKLGSEKLPEVLGAARALGITELEEAAFSWGLANLSASAVDSGALQSSSEQSDPVGDALRCFAWLCEVEELRTSGAAVIWRDALLQVHATSEVLASAAFLTLPPVAIQILLTSEDVHRDPGTLWQVCVLWARQRPADEMPSHGTVGKSATLKDEAKPRKLFIPGARLHTVAAAHPSESEVQWQCWLLPIAEVFHFSAMDASSFAGHVEAMNPMHPELAKAIYAARRRGLRIHE